MSTFSTLEIGKRALMAANFGLDVVSNNIANASTAGYSRRQAIQSEGTPFTKYGYSLGTGVSVESLRSFRNTYIDREIQKANAKNAGYEMDVQFYNSIETILQEPTDNDLGNQINSFLSYFDELALQPENIGLRENMLSMAQSLVERAHTTSNELQALRTQANNDLINQVNDANKLISQIADYNNSIAISKDKSGNDSLTYIDKREVAIEELSKFGNISVSYEDTGLANVFINGINVCTGTAMQPLKVVESVNDITGEKTLNVVTYDAKKNVSIQVNPTSGKMAASLKQFNVTLDPNETSSELSITRSLDNYIGTLADTINSLFATGYGLNDKTTPPQGTVLFKSMTGEPITAANIQIAITNPADIPLSDAPNSPGNAKIALSVAKLMTDGQFLSGQTPSEYYSNLIGRVSNAAKTATLGKEATQLVVEQLNNTRDSQMGVNMDEEAISLVKLQKNLEAAAKIISVNSEVLSTIIGLVK